MGEYGQSDAAQIYHIQLLLINKRNTTYIFFIFLIYIFERQRDIIINCQTQVQFIILCWQFFTEFFYISEFIIITSFKK